MRPFYLAETVTVEGPLTCWGVVRSADGSTVVHSKNWGRQAAEAVALRLNATHAEATAIERARLRPLLEDLEARLRALGALKPIDPSEIQPDGEAAPDEPENPRGGVSIDSLVKRRLLIAFARTERPGHKVLCTVSDGTGGVWYGSGRDARKALRAASAKLPR